jgi:membrane protein
MKRLSRSIVRRRTAPRFGAPSGRPLDRLTWLGLGLFAGLLAGLVRAPATLHGRAPWTGLVRRRVSSPTAISARGWRGVLRRAASEFNRDRIPAVAAGATFYALLALFPALGVFVSLYGLVGDVAKARAQIVSLRGLLPEGGVTVLTQQIDRLTAMPHSHLGLTFATSLVLSVWSANAGMKGLIAGLNIAYEEEERRGFVALNLRSLAFTVGAIVLALLCAAAIGATPTLLRRLHLAAFEPLSLLRWPALLALIVALISVLYRYGPSGRPAPWRWITPGGAFAGLGWVAMSWLFSIYVDHFGAYDRTYGSLGAVVGFMTWIWLTLAVVLAGAELNCELEREASPGP